MQPHDAGQRELSRDGYAGSKPILLLLGASERVDEADLTVPLHVACPRLARRRERDHGCSKKEASAPRELVQAHSPGPYETVR